MPRYKKYSYAQSRLIPVSFSSQILPGTFEYALNFLIDNELDVSIFDHFYTNDETGAPAYDPAILLKIILYAYSLGIISSREIARQCEQNVVFMALSADTRPHFTTIAGFISKMGDEIIHLFRNVLLICDDMELISKEMFAIDGCKLPSNASKEWSGTREDFDKKQLKMEKEIRRIVKRHKDLDVSAKETDEYKREQKQVETLRKKARKIKKWLAENDDKKSRAGNVVKSNITDNESAKMKSSHGVIQGYNGVAAVDAKRQVVVHAEAFGEAQENHLLKPMVKGVRDNYKAIRSHGEDVFKTAKLSADSGFHTEDNMEYLSIEKIDGYVADTLFRKRDPRFATAKRHKPKNNKKTAERFTPADFIYDPETLTCICPAGCSLYLKNRNFHARGHHAVAFQARESDCKSCRMKFRCLLKPNQKTPRQVHFFSGKTIDCDENYTEKMKRKIDSIKGRFLYSMRLATAEPVFGQIKWARKLNRFTLRGEEKVNIQWRLYCIVHNIGKIFRYGPEFA
jgi:transposase